jgi:hypothetical protein
MRREAKGKIKIRARTNQLDLGLRKDKGKRMKDEIGKLP